MGKEPADWTQAKTLEDYVIDLFVRKQTDSEEFKALLRIFGREKIVKIWEKYKELKNSSLK